jgi:hypothetical protein
MENTINLTHEDIIRSVEVLREHSFCGGIQGEDRAWLDDESELTQDQLNDPVLTQKLKPAIVEFMITGLREDLENGWIDELYLEYSGETIIPISSAGDTSWLLLVDAEQGDEWHCHGIWEHSSPDRLLDLLDEEALIKFWLDEKLDEFEA